MSTFHSDRCTSTACASAGLTADDRRAVTRAAHDALRGIDRPAISDHFNRCNRAAIAATGRRGWELRQSEVDDIAEIVCSAILDAWDQPVAEHPGRMLRVAQPCGRCGRPLCLAALDFDNERGWCHYGGWCAAVRDDLATGALYPQESATRSAVSA